MEFTPDEVLLITAGLTHLQRIEGELAIKAETAAEVEKHVNKAVAVTPLYIRFLEEANPFNP